MQPYPIHAEGTLFVQPNEARHIQTGVSGSAKRPRPLPVEMKADRRGWLAQKPVAPAPPTGFSRGGGCIFTINVHGTGAAPTGHPSRFFTINVHGDGSPPPPGMKIGQKILPTAHYFHDKDFDGALLCWIMHLNPGRKTAILENRKMNCVPHALTAVPEAIPRNGSSTDESEVSCPHHGRSCLDGRTPFLFHW